MDKINTWLSGNVVWYMLIAIVLAVVVERALLPVLGFILKGTSLRYRKYRLEKAKRERLEAERISKDKFEYLTMLIDYHGRKTQQLVLFTFTAVQGGVALIARIVLKPTDTLVSAVIVGVFLLSGIEVLVSQIISTSLSARKRLLDLAGGIIFKRYDRRGGEAKKRAAKALHLPYSRTSRSS